MNSGLTDQEQHQLGAQQAAILQMQHEKFNLKNFKDTVCTSDANVKDSGIYVISKTKQGRSELYMDFEYFEREERDYLYETLFEEIPWEQKMNHGKGRTYAEPRKSAWFGEIPYKYAGSIQQPTKDWHPILVNIRRRLETTLGVAFNSVLCNLYRSGADSIGWHADDEPQLGSFPTIASITLGATRSFLLKRKNAPPNFDKCKGCKNVTVPLTHGSLVVMRGATQEDWLHSIPKEFDEENSRINLTFRYTHPIGSEPDEMLRAIVVIQKKMIEEQEDEKKKQEEQELLAVQMQALAEKQREEMMKALPITPQIAPQIVPQIVTSSIAANSSLPQQFIHNGVTATVQRPPPENLISVQNIHTPVVHIATSPAVQVPSIQVPPPAVHIPVAPPLQAIPTFQLVASQPAPPPTISVQIAPPAPLPVLPSVIHVNPAAVVQSQVPVAAPSILTSAIPTIVPPKLIPEPVITVVQSSDLKSELRKIDKDRDEEEEGVKLPVALEKMLAFKGERVQQVGLSPEDAEKVEKGEIQYNESKMNLENDDMNMSVEEEVPMLMKKDSNKESKNKKKKKKKKRAAKVRKFDKEKQDIEPNSAYKDQDDDVEIEYVQEELNLERSDPHFRYFSKIFETFKISEPSSDLPQTSADQQKEEPKKDAKAKNPMFDSDDEDEPSKKHDDDKPKISKKKMKKMNRLSVAELKQLVARPDVVEMHDVTAHDPKLLVHLKATRNSVQVPRHWCFKRKYLQGKRGIEKPPFELPEFIQATGIMEMREALQEKEDQKSMKQKMRERVRPKMGKIDIDYKKLHDAFFRWQTKPKMTIHGDLYYEGKEFETKLREKKPGNMSDELRIALGMPIGAGCDKVPPPWLIAMQRYGPPPSYPNLKIAGLNAPIPEGCQFGYHAGGWGKPPVDEIGKPLYGDVFGTATAEKEVVLIDEEIDKTRWGDLESESESDEESESESEEEEAELDTTGLITPAETGLITPSGITSNLTLGMETPEMIELRKKRIEDSMEAGGDTPALYQVLAEKKASNIGSAMMGSTHIYELASAAAKKGDKTPANEGVDIALNPDELDMDTAAMQAKYDQTLKEQQNILRKEDLSDMVAEHAAKQQKKRKKQLADTGKSAKKYKEFKF